MIKQKSELTYKHNLKQGRHGWLRLTPAYSVKLVGEILQRHPEFRNVLDPFCGTGTTGLVSGQLGISCDVIEINPFLVWFARVKTSNYSREDLTATTHAARAVLSQVNHLVQDGNLWVPPIKNIDRWWAPNRLSFLTRLRHEIVNAPPQNTDERNLLLVAFCRLMMEFSNAAFNHQSMSFKSQPPSLFAFGEDEIMASRFLKLADEIVITASEHISGCVRVIHGDSRDVPVPAIPYDAVITSPPYPNRMSYIRELRPYMYWLGFLNEAREAAEIDWQAIGGTWGAATSWLTKWTPNGHRVIADGFESMIDEITERSPLLGNYVHRYFVDMSQHISSLWRSLASNARIFYIVGNSKFYDTLVPVEQIFAAMFRHQGFAEVEVDVLRKRNSKKELLEFVVKGRKP